MLVTKADSSNATSFKPTFKVSTTQIGHPSTTTLTSPFLNHSLIHITIVNVLHLTPFHDDRRVNLIDTQQ